MRNLCKLLLLLLWAGIGAECAVAQMTPVTAPSGTISFGASPITTGTAIFLPVDSSGKALAVTVSGGGLRLPGSQPVGYPCAIVAGGISGCSVPDVVTSKPSGFRYNVTFVDTSTGNPTSGQSFMLSQVQGISGEGYSLDLYDPGVTYSVSQTNAILRGSGPPPVGCSSSTSLVYVRSDVPGLFVCPGDAADWAKVIGPTGPPVTFRGAWSAAVAYAVGDAASYSDGSSYVRLVAGTTGGTPASDATNWGLLAAAGTLTTNQLSQLAGANDKANWAVTKALSYSSLTVEVGANGPSAAQTYPNGYSGYGVRLTPAGVSFNAIQIAALNRRSDADAVATAINIIIRSGTNATWGSGTLVAKGSAPVDPAATDYSGIIIPLVDPTSGAYKTLANTDLGSEYSIAVYATAADGTLAQLNPPDGALPNMVIAHDYYVLSGAYSQDPLGSSDWGHTYPGPSAPLTHVLLTDVAFGNMASESLLASIAPQSLNNPKANWAVVPKVTYSSLSVALSASGASSGTYPNGYSGYATRLTPSGVTFNAIQVPLANRIPTASPIAVALNVIVRGSSTSCDTTTGTVVAKGSSPVDPNALDYSGTVIPLVDPASGSYKTLTNADLGSEYCVYVYATAADGSNAQLNPFSGGMPNQVVSNDAYILTGATNPSSGSWYHQNPGPSPNPTHLLITNPGLGYAPSAMLQADLAPKSIGVPIGLPDKLYGVEGREMNVYLDSLAIARRSDVAYQIFFGNASTFYGQHQNERWTFVPTSTPVSAPLTVNAYDKTTGNLIGSQTATLTTVAAATTARSLKIMALGDSVTEYQNSYVAELYNIQTADANLKLTFIGTNSTTGLVGASNGIAVHHEGRAGWSSGEWWAPTDSDGQTLNKFYNSSTGHFDYAHYLSVTGLSQADVVTIHLGINDLDQSVADSDVAGIASVEVSNTENIIASIHAVSSSIKIVVCLTIPPADSEDGLVSSSNSPYAGRAWIARQRRNQIMMAAAQAAHFSGRESSNIYVAATNLALDTVNGWPFLAPQNVNSRSTIQASRVADSIHPNQGTGYLQMADAIWAALKNIYQ